ncbi:restriction endonuclease subunit S [Veillonella ratti]|uniref:restriction endonuclease subunit S n=1 Tax=Veillonella ratti TaxID=103892 RepID=UPI000F8F377E|nr:restriction endonuclease subunit S [Veillonella ratti]
MEKRKTPRIRFKGFSDDWEQRKITDVAEIFIGLVTTMTKNYRNKGTLLIRNSDIKENRFLFSDVPIFLEETFSAQNSDRKLCVGDVVTVHTGDIGTSAVVTEKETGAIGFATINTRPNQVLLDSNYLSTYFNTAQHKNFAISMATGDGRSNYNLKDFKKVLIPLSSVDEQQRIGNFFKNVNRLITLHQRKAKSLKMVN